MKAYARAFEWRPVEPGGPLDDPFHARVLARMFATGDATVSYPFGIFELLRGVDAWLAPDGVVLVTDFGHPQRSPRAGAAEPRPVMYGDSLNHAIQFATFDAFAAEIGWDVARTDDPLRSIQEVLLARHGGHARARGRVHAAVRGAPRW